MNLLIKKMTLKDLDTISNTLYSEFDNFWSTSILKSELEKPNVYYLIGKIDEEIVGFGGISYVLDEAELNYIVTKKSKRNLGIASKILYNLISFANTKHIKTITLEVNENNANAIKLYEKFYFKQIYIREHYYNNIDNAIIMRKHMS